MHDLYGRVQSAHVRAPVLSNGRAGRGVQHFRVRWDGQLCPVARPPPGGTYWYYTAPSTYQAAHLRLLPFESASFSVTTRSVPTGCNQPTLDFNFHADGGSPQYIAAPNPATDQLTVSDTRAASGTRTTAVPFQAVLFDTFGRQMKASSSTGSRAVLDVHDLAAGLYNLRIETGGQPVMQHIQVVH